MDDTDISFFSSKKKHDKADACATNKSSASKLADKISDSLTISDKPKVIVSRSALSDTYNSNHQCVGIAMILNHKEVKGQKPRLGTEKDRDDMKCTLERFGFDVRVYNDLTFAEINEQIKNTAQEDHTNNDCFVLVVMSHGNEGKVFAKDMSYPVERLWFPFLGDSCKSLINKPKLFFIQACRGENLEKPVVFDEFTVMSRAFAAAPATVPETQVITYAIPSTADMLVFYSTFEKFFSFRNVEAGSWFIQSLCYVFNAAAKSNDAQEEGVELLGLLTAVNRRVAYEFQSNSASEALNQMKEMPNFMSTLTKTFYLKVKPIIRKQ